VNHIIKTEHETAHIGMNKMIDLINRKYYGITSAKYASMFDHARLVRCIIHSEQYNQSASMTLSRNTIGI
jgi:hypothetical protein